MYLYHLVLLLHINDSKYSRQITVLPSVDPILNEKSGICILSKVKYEDSRVYDGNYVVSIVHLSISIMYMLCLDHCQMSKSGFLIGSFYHHI